MQQKISQFGIAYADDHDRLLFSRIVGGIHQEPELGKITQPAATKAHILASR